MKSFLIVEDDDSLRDLYSAMIRKKYENAHIDHAGNGRDALKMAKHMDYNAIIVDIDIPVMNGVELLSKLEEELPNMAKKTVFISGAVMSDENSYILERSRPYLLKPFTSDAFNTLVSLIMSIDEKKFVFAHSKNCTRQSARFRSNEECLISPFGEEQDAFQIKCRLMNYPFCGLAIQYEDNWLPATSEVQVSFDSFNIRNNKASIVWTKNIDGILQSGLKWV